MSVNLFNEEAKFFLCIYIMFKSVSRKPSCFHKVNPMKEITQLKCMIFFGQRYKLIWPDVIPLDPRIIQTTVVKCLSYADQKTNINCALLNGIWQKQFACTTYIALNNFVKLEIVQHIHCSWFQYTHTFTCMRSLALYDKWKLNTAKRYYAINLLWFWSFYIEGLLICRTKWLKRCSEYATFVTNC